MAITLKQCFGEITPDLDRFYLVLLFMVLLQCSSTIPQGGTSPGHGKLDMTMFKVDF